MNPITMQLRRAVFAARAVGVCLVSLAVLAPVAACTRESAAPGPASASVSPTTTTSPPAVTTADGARLVALNFPPGMVGQNGNGNPTVSQMHAALGIPPGQGPYPVAIVMHGTHYACMFKDNAADYLSPEAVTTTWPLVCQSPDDPAGVKQRVGPDYIRYDDGLSYLVQQLAAEGFVALSIDVQSAKNWWTGEVDHDATQADLVAKHVALLRDLNAGRDHGLNLDGLTGAIDTSRVALVGHSTSGGFVLGPTAAATPGLMAAVSLEPATMSLGTLRVPVMAISGTCDEDTGTGAGSSALTELLDDGAAPAAAIDVVVSGLGHAVLNTALEPSNRGDVCPASSVLAPGEARAQVAALVTDFLANVRAGSPTAALPRLDGLTLSATDRITDRPIPLVAGGKHTFLPPGEIGELSGLDPIAPTVPTDLTVDKVNADDI